MATRFGVIGAGVIGKLRAESIRSTRGIELVAVADPVIAAAEQAVRGSGAKPLAEWRELVALTGLDAVVISSPVHLHEEQALACFQAGAHVLCEKPLSNSLDSCRRILAAAEKAGKTLAVGFNHRYFPAVALLKKTIDDGTIGVVDHLRIFGGHDGLHNFRADWMYKSPLSGGGAMMDVGIHLTDLARYAAGEIAEVYGVATNNIWHVDGSEDNAVAVFKTVTGIPITYQVTWAEWRGYGFFIDAYGDRGMIRASYAPMSNILVTQDKPGAPRRRRRWWYPEIMVREKMKGWTSTTLLTFQAELGDFRKMIRGESGSLADGFSGLRAIEIADAVYRSTKTGAAIKLDPPGRPTR